MTPLQLKQLSKSLAWLLRHAAQQEGLLPDPQGWVLLDDVLPLLAAQCPGVTREAVQAVVSTVDPHKQRFSLEGGWIRANYGHSLPERICHPEASPPPTLYHGTHRSALEAILREGLRPMQRQYVHLTTDPVLARQVGSRQGPPVVLAADTAAARAAGVVFFRANPVFWLAQNLPGQCLRTLVA